MAFVKLPAISMLAVGNGVSTTACVGNMAIAGSSETSPPIAGGAESSTVETGVPMEALLLGQQQDPHARKFATSAHDFLSPEGFSGRPTGSQADGARKNAVPLDLAGSDDGRRAGDPPREAAGIRERTWLDRIEEIQKELEGFPKAASAAVAEEIRQEIQRQGTRLSPEQQRRMLQIARGLTGDNTSLLFRIHRAAHDFEGLRRLLQGMPPHAFYERFQALLCLEAYEEIGDLAAPTVDFREDLFQEFMPSIEAHIKDYVTRRVYHARRPIFVNYPSFSIPDTLADLSALSKSYDVAVVIATDGFFSGGIADFLGLPTRVVGTKRERLGTLVGWVGDIQSSDIAGKRVLLLDADTVTGRTIRDVVRLLWGNKPAGIGAYLNHGRPRADAADVFKHLEVVVHSFDDRSSTPWLSIFFDVHEHLQTPLGLLLKATRAVEDTMILPGDDAAAAIREHVEKQKELFFALNHFLPGAKEVRRKIVRGLESLLRAYEEATILGRDETLAHIANLVKKSPPLPSGFANELAAARDFKEGRRLATARSVDNSHVPSSYTSAFRNAQMALRDHYDIALIVGPEGLAYEPIFRDLGMETVAVNVPESQPGVPRTLTAFDNRTRLRGKRVLVVEDDVRTGATLQKVLEAVQDFAPAFLGLYLGAPLPYQQLASIPSAFGSVFTTRLDESADDAAFLRHLSEREVLFKRPMPEFEAFLKEK